MRWIVAVEIVAAAACHHGADAPSGPPANRGGSAAAAPGTTTWPGLDWGAPGAAIAAAYPGASAGAAGWAWRGPHEGRPAAVSFALDGGALAAIEVVFDGGFASMDACGAAWAPLRASLDGRLGPSQADNLAAYWKTPTTAITLACNPDDAGGAALGMRYEPAGRD